MKIKDLIFKIENIDFNQALEYIVKNCQKKGNKAFVVTLNPELVMLARNDSEYEKILKSADLAVCDGVGIVMAGKIFGKKFPGRIHGVDLVEKVSEAISQKPITVGFLGGGKNVAQMTADCLKNKYPGLKVVFALEEWPKNESRTKNQESRISNRNSSLSCDILFVAFGSPKQEKWIYDNLNKIDVRVAIGVGGAFDFISGNVRRAPVWLRKIGLEWLFRLIIQPWRWKRQLALIKFIVEVFKERIFKS